MADDEVVVHTEEYWSLEVDNTQIPRMTSVSVPSVSFTPNDFRHENGQARSESTKIAGKVQYGDITGTRIMDDDTTIQDWFSEADPGEGGGGGKVTKKEAVLYLRDAEGKDVKKWSMTGVWITSYSASASLDASGTSPITEMFSLTFDKLTIE
jgi:phage tail-like protein